MFCSLSLYDFIIVLAYTFSFSLLRISEQKLMDNSYYKLPFLYSMFYFLMVFLIYTFYMVVKRRKYPISSIFTSRNITISMLYAILDSLHFVMYMTALDHIDTLSASIVLIIVEIVKIPIMFATKNIKCTDPENDYYIKLDSNTLKNNDLIKSSNIYDKKHLKRVNEYDEFAQKDHKIIVIVLSFVLIVTISMTVSTNDYISPFSLFLLIVSTIWIACQDIIMKKYMSSYRNYVYSTRSIKWISSIMSAVFCFALSMIMESNQYNGTSKTSQNVKFPTLVLFISCIVWLNRILTTSLFERMMYKLDMSRFNFNILKMIDPLALIILVSIFFYFFKNTYDAMNEIGLSMTIVFYVLFQFFVAKKGKMIQIIDDVSKDISNKSAITLNDDDDDTKNGSSDDDDELGVHRIHIPIDADKKSDRFQQKQKQDKVVKTNEDEEKVEFVIGENSEEEDDKLEEKKD